MSLKVCRALISVSDKTGVIELGKRWPLLAWKYFPREARSARYKTLASR